MIRNKEVLFKDSAGGTLLAGAAGVGFMVEPYSNPTIPGTTDNLAGVYPVRVRVDGDAARDLIVTDNRPRPLAAGFK